MDYLSKIIQKLKKWKLDKLQNNAQYVFLNLKKVYLISNLSYKKTSLLI